MKILARIVMVLLLLSGLGYGSYAFGKYVLSNKLFGNNSAGLRTVSRATGQASAVTHHTDWKGDKPRVEVKVMPTDEDGAPTVIASDAAPRHASTPAREGNKDTDVSPDNTGKDGKKNLDDAPVEYSLGDKSGDNNSRRKRRHRHDKSSGASASIHAVQGDSAQATQGDGASTESASPTDAAAHEGDSSSISVASDDSVIKAPRTKPDGTTLSSPEKPTHRTRRHRDRSTQKSTHSGTKSRGESPVPQPESPSSGGEKSGGDKADISPVPQPE